MKEIVEQIIKLRKNAAIEPSLKPVTTRHGWEGKKRQAQALLPDAELKYKQQIQERIMGVIALGKNAEEFAKVTSTEYKLYSVNVDNLFERFTKIVERTLKLGSVFTSEQVLYVNMELEKIAKEMSLTEIPRALMDSKLAKAVNTRDELKGTIIKLIRNTFGVDLEINYILHEIGESALKDLTTSQLVPTVIYGLDSVLTNSLSGNLNLFRKGSFLVDTENKEDKRDDTFYTIEAINKKSVGEALATIKENLK